MDRVDGGDDGGGGRDDGRRYFPLIFLLFSSDFSLSFDFFPLSFFFQISEECHKNMEEFLGFMKRVCNKCEV